MNPVAEGEPLGAILAHLLSVCVAAQIVMKLIIDKPLVFFLINSPTETTIWNYKMTTEPLQEGFNNTAILGYMCNSTNDEFTTEGLFNALGHTLNVNRTEIVMTIDKLRSQGRVSINQHTAVYQVTPQGIEDYNNRILTK